MHRFRWLVVAFLALIPLATLIHKNDVGRWDLNRSAMVAPDEVSYLLLADNLLHGRGISIQHAVGRDTFYPPGFPLLLAGWSLVAGFTIFRAHLFNALLLSGGTVLAYVLARQLLGRLDEEGHRRFRGSPGAAGWLAVLIAGLFAVSWHVLEGAMFVFSEPAFMVTTFLWIVLALRWKEWPGHLSQTAVLALLAILAWSIRGAGIVCVATMLVFAASAWLGKGGEKSWRWKPLAAVGLIVMLAVGYQAAITLASPEKSLASVDSSDNSYGLQLQRGLTDGGRLHFGDPAQWPRLFAHISGLGLSHLDDYANVFTPWTREWMEPSLLPFIGKFVGMFGLIGWLYRLTRRRSATRFVELYVLFYTALYLVWPFNMSRFWAPLLPIMLTYGVDMLSRFSGYRHRGTARWVCGLLLLLLWIVSVEELALQLGNYGRRLNYVSDALAAAAGTVVRLSPDPQETMIDVAGSSEHFLFAWYLPRTRGYLPQSPQAHHESTEDLILRSMAALDADPKKKLFVISYFVEPRYSEVFDNLRRRAPALMATHRVRVVYQKEIVTTVWEIRSAAVGAGITCESGGNRLDARGGGVCEGRADRERELRRGGWGETSGNHESSSTAAV